MGKNAHESNRLVGERMVADEVRWLGAKAAELLADYQANQPAPRQPLTFMALEQIWASEVMPQLREFKTMQYLERTPPPADSTWQLNYRIPAVEEL
ncbi:MAG: hypothetical protein KDE58_01915 [Caldilineaceae bacterium]|nr:hypothetical protein [Caldilineaceae bacterium]